MCYDIMLLFRLQVKKMVFTCIYSFIDFIGFTLSQALNIEVPSDLAISGAMFLEGKVLRVGLVEEILNVAKNG